ncbi:hypothetical protein [Nonomuraea sp. NPDC049400]|uniref:hypothetical protein n=1 Tax=Nonomuraea sp. NPDC049400 TaxID=3364352 RepID=UPI0037A6D796
MPNYKRVSIAVAGAVLAGTAAITGVTGTASAETTGHDTTHSAHHEARSFTYGVDWFCS